MTLSEAWVDGLAGWVSGAAAVVLCQPMDTVLTRFQAGAPAVTKSATSSPTSMSIPQHYRRLVSSCGWTSLWRGSTAMISAVPFQNALLMGGYGLGKQYNNDETNTSLVPIFVGGLVGGICQSFLMSPVELIKVQQQVLQTTGGGATALNLMVGGPSPAVASSRVFKGLTATLWRDGIPHGVWFVSYEWCKTQMSESRNESEDASYYATVMTPLASGAFAAAMAWAVGYPFDIIKTRIQATPSSSLGMLETGQQLIQEANGSWMRGLYRGFGWKLVRAVPASMIGFTTYEWAAAHLR